MGNCFTQGAKTWVDDDEWDRFKPTSHELAQHQKKVSPYVKGGSSSTIVKIKLTKKQLEEILTQAGINTDNKLPIELLLKQAMNKGCEELARDTKRQQWRPNLQPITEAA